MTKRARIILLAVTITLVACARATPMATPTAEPTATPTPEPIPTEKITPIPTITKEPTIPPEPSPTVQPSPTQTREPTPAPEPCEVERCEAYQNLALYHNPTEEESFSKLIPGTNKTFVVKERSDGWMLIEVREPNGAIWEAWANDVSGAYGPVGQRPTPTEVPSTYCEAPHWPENTRTTDRGTGIVIYFGNPKQLIEPERPYIMKYYRAYIGDPWYTRRDARITAINKQTQVITFQLNDGTTRQRRYISDTIVIMEFHNKYRGQPETESVQYGGNFCDLEEGDVVSILHPDEPESANLNPDLVNLFGVLIVQ